MRNSNEINGQCWWNVSIKRSSFEILICQFCDIVIQIVEYLRNKLKYFLLLSLMIWFVSILSTFFYRHRFICNFKISHLFVHKKVILFLAWIKKLLTNTNWGHFLSLKSWELNQFSWNIFMHVRTLVWINHTVSLIKKWSHFLAFFHKPWK